jgi:hypothetical protein
MYYPNTVHCVRTGFGLITKSALVSESRDKTLCFGADQVSIGYDYLFECLCCSNQAVLCEGRRGSVFPTMGKCSVRLELNTGTHAVCFFVDGKQIPHCVADVPAAVYFAVFVRPFLSLFYVSVFYFVGYFLFGRSPAAIE